MLATPLSAQSFDDVVRGSLLHGWRGEDGRHMAAVHLTLAPGWKTYWRAPGDAGIPPDFDWTGSRNLSAVSVNWPTPIVFRQAGMRSVGYTNDLVIPLELHPTTATQPIEANLTMRLGVCEEVCIPVTLKLSERLATSGATDVQAITQALNDRPMTQREAGVGAVTCRTDPIDDGLRLTISVTVPPLAPKEDVVVELKDRSVWVSEPRTTRRGGILEAVAEMVPPDAAPFAMSREDVRVTILGAGRAIDIRGCTGA